jgi:3-methyladenine DNA glycosylase/8-oxoguanine DNA glycosylase
LAWASRSSASTLSTAESTIAPSSRTFAASSADPAHSRSQEGGVRSRATDADELRTLSDEDFIAALTDISGIGPWTAQGALLVALQREDAVLPGDLALRKAIRAAYQLDNLPTEQEVLAIAENWRPFRSLATSYLFASAFDA